MKTLFTKLQGKYIRVVVMSLLEDGCMLVLLVGEAVWRRCGSFMFVVGEPRCGIIAVWDTNNETCRVDDVVRGETSVYTL